jgi:hypothetical protein
MIWFIMEACLGVIFAGLTVIGLMIVFLVLCVIMRAVAHVLSCDFNDLLKPPR